MLQMNVSQEEFTRMLGVYTERQSGVSLHTLSPEDGAVDRHMRFSLRRFKGLEIEQATLRVLAKGGARISVRVTGVGRIGSFSSVSKKIPVSTAPVWTEIDLTDAVQLRLAGDDNRMELRLSCRNCFNMYSAVPELNLITRENVHSRTKRFSRTDCYKDNHRKRCCRHTMDVVFKDLPGFEFIIQPYSFDAGYCKGRCPARYNPAHHHALLQSLISKQDRQRAPRPCCAPSKLADLEILHLDQDDPTVLKVSTWKNMRVLECACS